MSDYPDACEFCGEPKVGLTTDGEPCADCAKGPLSCHWCADGACVEYSKVPK